MILAIKLETLSSRTDICFIKPQDLLALSKAICVWRFIKDRGSQDPKFLKYIPRIDKKSEEVKQFQSRTY
jgi:hypothetical protein